VRAETRTKVSLKSVVRTIRFVASPTEDRRRRRIRETYDNHPTIPLPSLDITVHIIAFSEIRPATSRTPGEQQKRRDRLITGRDTKARHGVRGALRRVSRETVDGPDGAGSCRDISARRRVNVDLSTVSRTRARRKSPIPRRLRGPRLFGRTRSSRGTYNSKPASINRPKNSAVSRGGPPRGGRLNVCIRVPPALLRTRFFPRARAPQSHGLEHPRSHPRHPVSRTSTLHIA